MPRVVPSQVVKLIGRLFPEVPANKREGDISFNKSRITSLAAVLDLCDRIPSELVTVEGEEYDAYVLSLAAIKTMIDAWNMRNSQEALAPFVGFGNVNPVFLLHRALSKCPDEFPSPQTSELAFITDPKLRESIRLDISTAKSANQNFEFKATTVLAGSAIEALLLWALDNSAKPRTKSKPREKYSMAELIIEARKYNFIKKNTGRQSWLAKDFRNLIHPGRAKRLQQKCNQGTAYGALAALELVVEDLTH